MSNYLTAKLGTDDLLECANCGGEPEWRDGSSTKPYIRCKSCGMRTPSSNSYDKLRRIWNTRPGANETCEWVWEHSGTLYDKFRCSKCGFLFVEPRCDQGYTDLEPNFCPRCGKRIREGGGL